MSDVSPALVGTPRRRREDPALLTGAATFTDDLSRGDLTYLAIRRSQRAHAVVHGIDTSDAEAVDGVVATYTWADIEASDAPGVLSIATDRLDVDVEGLPLLARDRVRYHGQPVAAVVATDRYAAAEAAAAITVDDEPLEAVTDPEVAASADAPGLYDGLDDNVAYTRTMGDADATEAAFDDADHVVELDLVNNRLIPSAMEPRSCLAEFDRASGRLIARVATQNPHGNRRKYAGVLGLSEREIRVAVPSMGGGFGYKSRPYPADTLACWCAVQLERPVKWIATRSEDALGGTHGRGLVQAAALALDDDGTFRGLRVRTFGTGGGYSLEHGALRPAGYIELASSQYVIPEIRYEVTSAFTNTAPIHAYRGAGRPETIFVTERLIDVAAARLGLDPVGLRRHNLIPADAFPYETAAGYVYDSGEYERALDVLLEAVDYDALRTRQAELRAAGRPLGIGIAGFVEATGPGYQTSHVRVSASGDVTVSVAGHSHGQGHATTFAQIAADELGLSDEVIEVVDGDTDRDPNGRGTLGSRSTVTGGNAVREGARRVREKATRIAAHHLEADADDLVVDDGVFRVRGAPARSIAFATVAAAVSGGDVPEGMEYGLDATAAFEAAGTAFAFGAHAAVVEVDPETGEVELERYVAVDDCGVQINPMIVEGQIHGGLAQGIGQARFEAAGYDDTGTLRTATFADYAVPRALHLPEFESLSTETPSPHNPLGVKGVGEAGTIAAPPAVANAVADALAPFGVDHVDMPITDEAVWRAIDGSRAG